MCESSNAAYYTFSTDIETFGKPVILFTVRIVNLQDSKISFNFFAIHFH